jgi:hypothetical protein
VAKIVQRTLASCISGQATDRQNVLEERFSFICQLIFLLTDFGFKIGKKAPP